MNVFIRGFLGIALALVNSSVVSAAPAITANETPALTDQRVPLPPIVIPVRPTAPDRRLVWIGAGMVLLAAGLGWNQRRRSRLTQRSGSKPG